MQAGLNKLAGQLVERKRNALYRQPRVTGGAQQPEMLVDGRLLLSFCSNDYLGLAADPRVAEAFKQGVDEFGSGSGAAHLVTGHSAAHQALEEELAEFTGRDRALLFSSGYMANLGVVSGLLGRGDSVLQDRLNHASLIDGGGFRARVCNAIRTWMRRPPETAWRRPGAGNCWPRTECSAWMVTWQICPRWRESAIGSRRG